MNIFAKIKKFFSRDIALDENQKSLIVPMQLRGGYFKIGAKVEVPSGFSFVVAYKGKPYDVLQEGTHQISPLTMPNIGTKLKLYVADKKGRVPQKFKADAYFINKKPTDEIEFSSYRTLRYVEGKTRFKIRFKAKVSFEIEKQDKFVKLCLANIPKIKEGDSENFVCALLTERATDKLDKQTYSLKQFEDKDAEIVEFVREETEGVMKDIGLKATSFEITEIDVKTKKKEAKEKRRKEKAIVEKLPANILEKIKIQPEAMAKCEEGEVSMYDDQAQKQQETPAKSKEFVDLSLGELYSEKAKSKICPNCYAKNLASAEYCYSCREKLSKGEENV